MLEAIVFLLNVDHHYGQGRNIEIAKGKNKIPTSLAEGWQQFKRNREWQKR